MKTLIKVLKVLIVLTGAGLSVAYFIPDSGFVKIGSYLATMALPFAMDLLRVFGVKISKKFELAYLLFIIPAMIVGIDFKVYQIIYPFDKVVHTLSGVLVAFGAKEILDQASGKPDEMWFKVLFLMSFVALTAVLWECVEFSMDQIMGEHMQQLIAPGIEDTMYDMIVALIGGLIGTFMAFPIRKARKKSR